MDIAKIHIGLLEGKSNWATWKYKISIIQRGVENGLDVVECRISALKPVVDGSTEEEQNKYEKNLAAFKTDSNVLLIITVNLTQETLEKVMRFTTACEVWKELHRLYDGNTEDRTYDLCMQFFSYRRLPDDDIATHTSKLKNLWNQSQLEVVKDKTANGCRCDLPELLLICKILETLPEEYFSFKSGWLLMNKAERTIDNLTNQLCVYEKGFSNKTHVSANSSEEVLVMEKYDNTRKKFQFRKDFVCYYCKENGHKIKHCKKWIKDGKP